jgi:hypothetical protein
MKRPKVFVGMPHYGFLHVGAARGLYNGPSRKFGYTFYAVNMSLLTAGFNHLWVEALNRRETEGITHFAMIHADVEPVDGWVDILMEELMRLDADVVSTVIPIKGEWGLTSTGVEEPDGMRRLTMREICRLPETFSSADVGGRPLLLNTGLFVCDLLKPWAERVCFQIHDEIYRDAAGRWHYRFSPEDWNFSKFLHRSQCKIFATRKVGVKHHGDMGWDNQNPWGKWDRDHNYPGKR